MKRAGSLVLRNICALTIVLAAMSSSSMPQTSEVQAKPITDADVKLLREDLQSLKTQIITDTMAFNEKDAAAFGPIYKEYATAQKSIAEKRFALITDYAQNLDKMNDTKARELTDRLFAIEDETQALRKKYFPRFEKAVGAKLAAKFYQVDNRLTQMVNIQLASEIPLIP
jgi:hypothetical protein